MLKFLQTQQLDAEATSVTVLHHLLEAAARALPGRTLVEQRGKRHVAHA